MARPLRLEFTGALYYRRFVAEGKGQPSPWEQLKQQVFLGSDAFVDAMQGKIPKERDLREVPQARRRPVARQLAAQSKGSESGTDLFSTDKTGVDMNGSFWMFAVGRSPALIVRVER